jgi:mono/diheme cytochrome c family protein
MSSSPCVLPAQTSPRLIWSTFGNVARGTAFGASRGREMMTGAGAALALGVAIALIIPGAAKAGGTSASTDLFAREVRPLLADACFHCHGPDPGTRKEGLRFDLREGLFGSESFEPMVVPGDPEASLIYQRITAEDPEDAMPPPDFHKQLSAEEIALVRTWIEGGAGWQDHWAFVVPETPAMPELGDESWVSNPVDRFVLARLEEAGLEPAPPADPRTLVRRLSLDLTGLPPDPEEVEAFAADPSPEAYEALVDRLLSSPRWGEHRGALLARRGALRRHPRAALSTTTARCGPTATGSSRRSIRTCPSTSSRLSSSPETCWKTPRGSQLIATGFQRCNVTTNEGGSIDEEVAAMYAKPTASRRPAGSGWG